MSSEPKFVPRNYLEVPSLFGKHPDPFYNLATEWDDAVNLAWAREQHELAYAIKVQMDTYENSIADVAAALQCDARNLGEKFNGVRPAQHRDLIVWC